MLVPLSAAAEAGQGAELVAAVIPGQLEAEMVFAATGSPVGDWPARYQVAGGYYLASELAELGTATTARLAGPERRASLLDIMFAAGDHARIIWFACNGRGPTPAGVLSGPRSYLLIRGVPCWYQLARSASLARSGEVVPRSQDVGWPGPTRPGHRRPAARHPPVTG